jgi:hypothetical protein
MKTCTGCGEEKSFDEYQWKIKAKNLRHPKCKVCARAASREQHQKRLTERKEKQAAYRAANKEKRSEYDRQYREDNLPAILSKNAARHAAKLKATPLYADRVAIDYIYHAAQVIKETYGTTWHVDHIVPLQGENVCGFHIASNLQLLSPTDNIKKSNKFEAA